MPAGGFWSLSIDSSSPRNISKRRTQQNQHEARTDSVLQLLISISGNLWYPSRASDYSRRSKYNSATSGENEHTFIKGAFRVVWKDHTGWSMGERMCMGPDTSRTRSLRVTAQTVESKRSNESKKVESELPLLFKFQLRDRRHASTMMMMMTYQFASTTLVTCLDGDRRVSRRFRSSPS